MPVTYDNLAHDVKVGGRILVDDGLLEFEVLSVSGHRVTVRALHGGPIKSHKGMNLPGIDVSAPSLTAKDRDDIDFAVAHDLDYLALSFVRRADDIRALKALVPKAMLVVAKIEKDSALRRLEEILQASDAVMVARGDLGVELPFEEVPLAQKRIIGLANRYGRPVITATQMLESMIEHPASDARRGERRGQRRARRHRRRDALGGDRGRALPATRGGGDAPDRDRRGDPARGARAPASTASSPAPRPPRRRSRPHRSRRSASSARPR